MMLKQSLVEKKPIRLISLMI
ncbi:hypothetical protein QR98_0087040 [Sarcoptes scabiei]|uniref:Uncharacterized protein n=1 Tax=Sarcoptes scabiei TaxID=52283 RepID=A0A132AGP0_SARSC|nr:hypothetical protein QR98_0087040 [Sarcoptes scabiei]